MQYQFAGTDPQGRLIYEPISQQNTSTNSSVIYSADTEVKTGHQVSANKKSWFSDYFIIQDGVISFSLKALTLVFCIAISGSLLAMLYQSCSAGTFECDLTKFPMVSDVIAQEMYNRTFILLTATLMFGVQQGNLRAFYKKLYGIISNCFNDFLLVLGILSMFALPLIGIFDEHMWPKYHGASAVVFFSCFGFYSFFLGRCLYQNKDKFPASEQDSINKLYKCTWILLGLLLGFGLSIAIYGNSSVSTPLLEWAVVLYYVNFFALISNDNDFYDSIHQEGTLVPKNKSQ